jgi:hypothetical protein
MTAVNACVFLSHKFMVRTNYGTINTSKIFREKIKSNIYFTKSYFGKGECVKLRKRSIVNQNTANLCPCTKQ